MALYLANDGVTPVTTHSMLKTFRNCPREAYYKYALRLQPKMLSTPLTRGSWIHALLEVHYKGGNWKKEHKRWTHRFNTKYLDEEKEYLGYNLPDDIYRLMQSYFWHYADDPWEVLETEMLVEALLPNGHLFRGKVDLLIRDSWGDTWAVDHKSHKRLPNWDFRMFDEQSTLYSWALGELGYNIKGFTWNYLSTAGITVPKVVIAGDRFYKGAGGNSDYPSYLKAMKAHGFLEQKKGKDRFTPLVDVTQRELMRAELKRLKDQRWSPDMTQTSPHFRRDQIAKTSDLTRRVLAGVVRTSEAMHSYDFTDPDSIERNVNICKSYLCHYRNLSLGDLINGDSQMTQKREYQTGDPLAYYGEEEETL